MQTGDMDKKERGYLNCGLLDYSGYAVTIQLPEWLK